MAAAGAAASIARNPCAILCTRSKTHARHSGGPIAQTTSAEARRCEIVLSLEDGDACEQPRCLDFLILDEALTHLAEIKPRYARIIELRYLAGLTISETAEVLEISHATV